MGPPGSPGTSNWKQCAWRNVNSDLDSGKISVSANYIDLFQSEPSESKDHNHYFEKSNAKRLNNIHGKLTGS